MTKPVSVRRVVWTSFFVDLLDIILNITVAVLTGSIVMVAELLQAIADLTSSLFLIVGINRSKKEVFMWTMLSALMMLFVGASMSFYFGYQRYINPEAIDNIVIAFIALIIAAVSNGYAFFISVRRIQGSKKNKNIFESFEKSKLIMTKNTFVLDLMGMSSALTGLTALALYLLTGNYKFDGLGAMGIGVILGILSLRLIFDLIVKNNRGELESET